MTNRLPDDVEAGPSSSRVLPRTNVLLEQAGRFPVLDKAQLDVLRSYGTEQDVRAGEVLFTEGDESYDLIVVLEGEVQIARKLGTPK